MTWEYKVNAKNVSINIKKENNKGRRNGEWEGRVGRIAITLKSREISPLCIH